MAHAIPRTVQKKYSATPMVLAYLNDLTRSGLYGSKLSEVAGRLIARAIEDLISKGVLARKTELPNDWNAADQDEPES